MEEKINLDEHLDYRKLFTAIVEKRLSAATV